MKRWRLRRSDEPLDAALVADVMAGIGADTLARHCLDAMQRVMPVTFCTVFSVGMDGRLTTVSAASRHGSTAERTAAQYVAKRFDLLDPHMRWLAGRPRPRRAAQLWLGHHRGDELVDADYRAACYGDVGIHERASVLSLDTDGQRAAVSFYRSLAQDGFTADDFDALGRHAGLLADAVRAHARATPAEGRASGIAFEAEVALLGPQARAVIAQLRAGRSAKEAARALGLKPTTVRTHQYRAFKRLGIHSVRELLCGRAG